MHSTKRLTRDEFISASTKIHGSKYNYSLVVYKNGKTGVSIICPFHGAFVQRPFCHSAGQGCPKCKHALLNEINTKTTLDFVEKANAIHNNAYEYSLVDYKHNKKPVKIVCHKHGAFYQTPNVHLDGHGCPKCISIISKREISFLDALEIPNTRENRQVLIARKKVDGLVGDVVYEFLGDYWHGNPSRFAPLEVNEICHQTYAHLYKQTIDRFKVLNNLGYKVKYIWESEWKMWEKTRGGAIPLKEFGGNDHES